MADIARQSARANRPSGASTLTAMAAYPTRLITFNTATLMSQSRALAHHISAKSLFRRTDLSQLIRTA